MKNNICFDPLKVYKKLKPNYPDVILFIRCNQQYKCFDADMKSVIKLAGIGKETGIQNESCYEYSIPCIKFDQVISKLAKAGLRVGVCDPIDECSP